jgi:hypothetical protein
MKSIYIAMLAAVISARKTPTAVFHGLGDQCLNPGMHDFTREIAQKTDAYAHCVEVAQGSFSSFFLNFKK